MSFTSADSPLMAGLLGDKEIARRLSAQADLDAMLRFEIALATAQARVGLIGEEAGVAIAASLRGFRPDMDRLAAGVARDGVVVPELVRQLRVHVGDPHGASVHLGATSQDVVDTSLVLRLGEISQILRTRIGRILQGLEDLRLRFGSAALMGRTRMQAAMPITAADRIASWLAPLGEHLLRLDGIEPRLMKVQLGGAVGTLDAMQGKGEAVIENLAVELGLYPARQWHAERSGPVEFAGWLSLLCGSLGKIGQDVALMAQNGIGDVVLSGGGGSSAMPHKQNPVKAEVLVSLARHAATLGGGMQHAMVHEQERSGSAWTLEWMLLPPLCITAGAATRQASELVGSIRQIGS